MPTYTYDPANVTEKCKDRMRLELGDTTLAPGELTAALCDEEYTAIISQYSSWKKAKLKCLEAILMRFAHQVNISHDGMSYSFSSRVEFWKKLYDEMKMTSSVGIPTADPASLLNTTEGEPAYFWLNMQTNPRKGVGMPRRRK